MESLREFFNLLHDHLHACFFREQHSKFEIRVWLKNIPISLSQHRQFFFISAKGQTNFFLCLHSVNFILKVLPTAQCLFRKQCNKFCQRNIFVMITVNSVNYFWHRKGITRQVIFISTWLLLYTTYTTTCLFREQHI